MNPSSRHRIFRCTLEVRGVARSQADAWRRRARALWSQELAPILESACNATFPGETRRIRRLEVEVAWRPGEGEPALVHAFGSALKERMGKPTRLGAASPHASGLGGTLKPAAGLDKESDSSLDAGASPEAVDQGEWLELWLRTGLLPWWVRGTEISHIAGQLLDRLRSPAGTSWFRHVLTALPASIRRLAFQFDDSWHQAALRADWPAGTALLEPLLALARTPGTGTPPLERAEVWSDAWRLWSRRAALSTSLERAAAAFRTRETGALEQFRTALAREAGQVPRRTDVAKSATSNAAPALSVADLAEKCWRLWAEVERPSPELSGLARQAARARDLASIEQFHDALRRSLGSDAPETTGRLPEPLTEPTSAARSDSGGALGPELADETDLSRLASECWRLRAELEHPPEDVAAAAREAQRHQDAASLQRFHQALVGRIPGREPLGRPPTTDTDEGQSSGAQTAASPAAARPPGTSEAVFTAREPNAPAEALERVCSPGLPVAHAGLVLIAPFLPAFFDALGIHLPGDSHERGAAASAPLLLHWLATGQDAAAAEHALALPKLLCGLALDEPVVCQQAFSPELIAEAERLLGSVLEHWTALRQTSTQGLREAFLQRPGVLRDTGPQWLLRVEHRAWDVLLDRVPWTFRTIRLPWMPRPLMVEWEAYA